MIITAPAVEGGRHFGSRIVFDKDNYLYFSNGERGSNPENAQTLENFHGKIHRIHDDGRVPEDNPFVNETGAVASIWTYGNRNPQGLVYDKANNRIFGIEHGPKGGDEIKIVPWEERKKVKRGPCLLTEYYDYGNDQHSHRGKTPGEKRVMEQLSFWSHTIAPVVPWTAL